MDKLLVDLAAHPSVEYYKFYSHINLIQVKLTGYSELYYLYKRDINNLLSDLVRYVNINGIRLSDINSWAQKYWLKREYIRFICNNKLYQIKHGFITDREFEKNTFVYYDNNFNLICAADKAYIVNRFKFTRMKDMTFLSTRKGLCSFIYQHGEEDYTVNKHDSSIFIQTTYFLVNDGDIFMLMSIDGQTIPLLPSSHMEDYYDKDGKLLPR